MGLGVDDYFTQKKKCIIEVGEYNGQKHQNLEDGEFSVDALPKLRVMAP